MADANRTTADEPHDTVARDLIENRIVELQAVEDEQKADNEKLDQEVANEVEVVARETGGVVADLLERYADLMKKHKQLERECRSLRGSATRLQDENARVATQLTSSTQLKGRLESLCRELHRENKRLQAQSELATQQEALLTQAMEVTQNVDVQLKSVSSENTELREKLTSVLHDTALKDELYEKQLHMKDLELELFQKRLEQQMSLAKISEERAQKLEEQIEMDAKLVNELQGRLEIDSVEIEAHRKTLGKSKEVFGKLSDDVLQMKATVKEQQTRMTALHVALEQTRMRAEKGEADRDKAVEAGLAYEQRIEVLEKLCRQLQALNKKQEELYGVTAEMEDLRVEDT